MGSKRIYLGSKTSKYALLIGAPVATITSLFLVLLAVGFTITGSDDVCLGTPDDPCVSYGKICNTLPNNYDIYNSDEFKMDFSPTLENYWIFFKDGRYTSNYFDGTNINFSSSGWRYENFTNATKPRSDRVYVHRFPAYTCQEYMLVGLKENSEDTIKWGVGVGDEYLDPFWYGPENTNDTNLKVEIGNPINITASVDGATTTCVDIDHPEYGDNYTCGSPNATFEFNISYFRNDEFNDSSAEKQIEGIPTLLNDTCPYGCSGYIIDYQAFESCINLSINKTGTVRVDIDLQEYWSSEESSPIIRIRNPDTSLSEEFEITIDDIFTDGEYSVYSEKVYEKNKTYGFCLRHTEAGEQIGLTTADWFSTSPSYVYWPSYGIDMTTGEVITNQISKGHEVHVYSTSDDVYFKANKYDEVVNLSINMTSDEIIEGTKIFINGTEVANPGIVVSGDATISEFSNDVSSVELLFDDSTILKYFSIPKDSIIKDATINLSGFVGSFYTSETEQQTDGTNYITDGSCMLSTSKNWRDGDYSTATKLYDNTQTDPCAWYFYGNYSNPTNNETDSRIKVGFGNSGIGWTLNDTTTTLPEGCYGNDIIQIRTDVYLPNYCSGNITIACYNYTSSNWVDYFEDSRTTCSSSKFMETKIYEEQVNPNKYPSLSYLEVGITDGVYEWNFTGEFNETYSPSKTENFSEKITDVLELCTADSSGFCDVPIYFYGDKGTIQVDAVNILFSYETNPILLNSTVLSNYLLGTSGDVNVPLTISIEEGDVNITDLKYDYIGGNDTIEIFAFEQGDKTNNETFNLFVYASSFLNNLPYDWTDYVFFLPKTNSSKNVTAYGQTDLKPAYNITTTNYGDLMNLSIKVNETYPCMNLSWATSNLKNESKILTENFSEIQGSMDYLTNLQIWFWADLDNCDSTEQLILNPKVELKSYCDDCEWSE